MKTSKLKQQIFPLLFALCCLSVSACSRPEQSQKEKTQDTAWQNLIPSESDILLLVNMQDLRESGSYTATRTESARDLLLTRAGFSYDDITAFIMSSDLDRMPSLESLKDSITVDANGKPDASALSAQHIAGINATALLRLSKTITWDQASEAVDIFFSSVTNASIETIPNEDTLLVTQDSSPTPLRVNLSDDGSTIIMRTGIESISTAAEGQIPEVCQQIENRSASAPIVISMVASSKMRALLGKISQPQQSTGKKDTSSIIMSAALKAFASFKNALIRITPSQETTDIHLEMELGTERDALEAEAAVRNILIPVITLAMSQYSQEPGAQPVLQQTTTDIAGAKVILRSSLNTGAVKISP